MQTENSVLQGGQQAGVTVGHGAGGPGNGVGGGGVDQWQGVGIRGGINQGVLGLFGPGTDPPGLSVSSSGSPYSHPRRDRQAFSMYEPGASPGPLAHGPPALDCLVARLQPLNTPSVS